MGITILISVVVYLAIMLIIGIWCNKRAESLNGKGNFLEEYFIGGRSMGGFVLALTLIATFASASSFLGGPGIAYDKGLSWVYLSMIQVPTAFLTLGVLGKKFAIIARRINAVTVIDFIRARYESSAVAILSAIALLIFFSATMVAQFVGGATLFQVVTGYSYTTGLIIFGLVVVVYTTFGGFRAVALTDAIQGVLMIFGTIMLLAGILNEGGGINNIVATLNEVNPTWTDPTAGGGVAKNYLMSFWILVGLGILGLPQTTVRGMGFKDSKSMHNAMIIGTAVVGCLLLGMHVAGVWSRAIIPTGITVSDTVIPTVILQIMPPILAGIFIAAPLAAIMSTVDSMLILASAAIIKDIYIEFINKGGKEVKKEELLQDEAFNKKLSKLSYGTTLVLGAIVFVMALNPPDLIVWINLFAFGGLEAAFLCPTIFGLYWKGANKTGAICSIIVGVGSFFYLMINSISIAGTHQIVVTVIIAIITFIIGSLMGKKPSEDVLRKFY